VVTPFEFFKGLERFDHLNAVVPGFGPFSLQLCFVQNKLFEVKKQKYQNPPVEFSSCISGLKLGKYFILTSLFHTYVHNGHYTTRLEARNTDKNNKLKKINEQFHNRQPFSNFEIQLCSVNTF
jgi:hypothetical protein